MIHPIAAIQQATAAHFGVSVGRLIGKERGHYIVLARHVAIYLTRIHTRASYPDISRWFGSRDHRTCMHAFKKIGKLHPLDAGVADAIGSIERALKERAA